MDLDRSKRECHDAHHAAKLEADIKATELELLTKKLNQRMGYSQLSDLKIKIEASESECRVLARELQREKEKNQNLGKIFLAC